MRTATPGSKSYDAMRLPHKSFLLSRLTLARASKGHGTVSARASSKLYLSLVACEGGCCFRVSRRRAHARDCSHFQIT